MGDRGEAKSLARRKWIDKASTQIISKGNPSTASQTRSPKTRSKRQPYTGAQTALSRRFAEHAMHPKQARKKPHRGAQSDPCHAARLSPRHAMKERHPSTASPRSQATQTGQKASLAQRAQNRPGRDDLSQNNPGAKNKSKRSPTEVPSIALTRRMWIDKASAQTGQKETNPSTTSPRSQASQTGQKETLHRCPDSSVTSRPFANKTPKNHLAAQTDPDERHGRPKGPRPKGSPHSRLAPKQPN